MKKQFLNASMMTVLTLSANIGWSDSTPAFTAEIPTEVSHTVQNNRSVKQLFAKGTCENLKAYHVGLCYIFPNYQIPSSQDLLDSIRSHAQFVGSLTTEKAHELLSAREDAYLIFEESNRKGHFYIAHSGGLRHFSVMLNETGITGLKNGNPFYYPTVNHLIRSTVTV